MNDLVAETVLQSGVDDWVSLIEVVGIFRGVYPTVDYEDSIGEVIEIIEFLKSHNLVQVGTVGEDGFSPWVRSTEISGMLSSLLHSDGDFGGQSLWAYSAWLSNTQEGDRIGLMLHQR